MPGRLGFKLVPGLAYMTQHWRSGVIREAWDGKLYASFVVMGLSVVVFYDSQGVPTDKNISNSMTSFDIVAEAWQEYSVSWSEAEA